MNYKMKKILYNAKVYVEQNVFEEAVLVDGGYIEAVGKNDEILALKDDDTELIDCEGKTLIPGLNDSHLHFMQFGETLNQVNIEGVTSIDEMVERCQDFLAKYPEKCKNGMHAIGWNQDYFVDGGRLPNRHDLDRISTDFPIVLERVCGHIVSSNTKAIEIPPARACFIASPPRWPRRSGCSPSSPSASVSMPLRTAAAFFPIIRSRF